MCQFASPRIFEVPYRYSVQGKAKLALRSAAFGTWLSVTSEGATWQDNAAILWVSAREFRSMILCENRIDLWLVVMLNIVEHSLGIATSVDSACEDNYALSACELM